MKKCLVMFLTLGFLATAAAQDEAAKAELKRLQGKWVRISVDADGKKATDGDKMPDKAVTLTIAGDKYGGEKFKIDPSKNPKQIDISTTDDKGKPAILPGIYELKDDILKVCFPFPFEGKFDKIGNRPTEFRSKAGGNDVLEVYRREKK